MELNSRLDNKIKNYLLGTLPEAEQESLEEQVLTDKNIFVHILVREDELIDDYLEGTLSKQEKRAFEKYFLAAPERQKKMSFARALSKSVAASTASKKQSGFDWILQALRSLWPLPSPLPRYAFAAVLLVVGMGLSWVTLKLQMLEREADQLRGKQANAVQLEEDLRRQLDEEVLRTKTLKEELQQRQSRAAREEQRRSFQRPLSLAFSLYPGLVRDLDGLKTVEIPGDIKLIELNLQIIEGEKYDSYRAILQAIDGDEVAIQNRLTFKTRDGGEMATLAIPASLLLPGDYFIRLSGIRAPGSPENIGKYYFRVSRK